MDSDLVLVLLESIPGWLDANLNSGINDAGESAVFRGGCKEFVSSIRGTLIDVLDDDD